MTEAPSTLPEVNSQPLPSDGKVILRAEHITKVFPGTIALSDVDFNTYQGKVNVLVGENGAGKSTLMKILAGVEEPTEGRLILEGQPVRFRSPIEASSHGIGIIYQELDLFPNLSIVENIFMAREITAGAGIDQREQERRTRELLAHLEHPMDPRTLVGDLRLGQQQIVAIARALAQNVRILIMDEPTSALSRTEVTVLFKVIRELKARGVSIIYISHKLDELLQIGDYLTVLRDGKLQAEAPIQSVNLSWIIEKMVGRNPAGLFTHENHAIGGELLRVDDLSLLRPGSGYFVDHVSFTLHAGEILGIYGLMGAGRTELFECLSGLHPEASGAIYLNGEKVTDPNVDQRIAQGIVLIPEDRQASAIVPTLSVSENMVLASLSRYVRRGALSFRAIAKDVVRMIKNLSIKVSNPEQPITALSGGNQQKVVVGKGLMTGPKVFIMDEPTRGIDVAAKSDMAEVMNMLAKQGYGILFSTSELKEILAISDRILVMSKGKITSEMNRSEATEEALVNASAVGHGPIQE
ncbi:MAG TPA: sugar ABC transporter ATP-binding protein [Anaerolineaceae bacterium]|nr:sugar ABC transporter ATP-binding protein [Anaerolineaceae bacterium]